MVSCGFAVLLCFSAERALSESAAQRRQTPEQKRSVDHRLPPALQKIPLERLSSGALRLLDKGGNLVQWPAATSTSANVVAIDPGVVAGLDPRVGANIRLGNDPSQLPSNQRAQAEPHIARHATDADFLAATFQEGRYTDGGAIDCGYAISHDGGLTWSRALTPGVTTVVGGPYLRATDPVAAIDLNSNVFLNTLAIIDANQTMSALLLSRSTNGGASFDPPIEVMRSPDSSVFLDKNWMAVNTFANTPTAGRIFLTVTRFAGSFSPIIGTFSDDRGKTWSPSVAATPSAYSAQASYPIFVSDGTLAVVYWNFSGDRIEVVVSTNGGSSFNSPRLVTAVTRYDAPVVRDGSFVPAVAVDRGSRQLFVVYQAIYQTRPRILFTKSPDAGVTWSTPQPVSDNPGMLPVFNPAIAVSPNGQVVSVVFYDGRVNANTNQVDMFLAQSFDGGTNWQPNIRLTDISTDVRLAPLTGSGYMLGDYLGVAESRPDVPVVPVWVDTRTGNPDPFVTRVGMAPQVTFASWRAARFSFAQISNPLQGAPSANPDGDGVLNLVEYALALNPWAADQPFFNEKLSTIGGVPMFTISYERLAGASDLVYSWKTSADLKNWRPISPAGVTMIANASRRTEQVLSSFVATNAQQFFQLGVTLTP